MIRGVEVDAVFRAWGDDLLAVEVGAAESGGECLVMTRELATASGTVEDFGSQFREMRHIANGRRANEEEFGG